MTDVIGFDIDGRPLRAGDEVVAAWVAPGKEKYINNVFVVVGPSDNPLFSEEVLLSVLNGRQEAGLYGKPSGLRKRHNDHLPAPQTYEQLIQSLKTGETA